MEIDEKYFKLLNLLIYDKRYKMSGMITGIVITQHFGGTMISYQAFMNHVYSNVTVFVEDFLKGNIVFLLPFALDDRDDIFMEMAERHEVAVKEFFDGDFKPEMIMRISEDERQAEIQRWRSLVDGLRHWENYELNKEN